MWTIPAALFLGFGAFLAFNFWNEPSWLRVIGIIACLWLFRDSIPRTEKEENDGQV